MPYHTIKIRKNTYGFALLTSSNTQDDVTKFSTIELTDVIETQPPNSGSIHVTGKLPTGETLAFTYMIGKKHICPVKITRYSIPEALLQESFNAQEEVLHSPKSITKRGYRITLKENEFLPPQGGGRYYNLTEVSRNRSVGDTVTIFLVVDGEYLEYKGIIRGLGYKMDETRDWQDIVTSLEIILPDGNIILGSNESDIFISNEDHRTMVQSQLVS